MSTEMLELAFDEIVIETEEAMLIEFEPEVQVWLPKSQCSDPYNDIVEVPEWLAIDKNIEEYEI